MHVGYWVGSPTRQISTNYRARRICYGWRLGIHDAVCALTLRHIERYKILRPRSTVISRSLCNFNIQTYFYSSALFIAMATFKYFFCDIKIFILCIETNANFNYDTSQPVITDDDDVLQNICINYMYIVKVGRRRVIRYAHYCSIICFPYSTTITSEGL